jgi:hypothetical protein
MDALRVGASIDVHRHGAFVKTARDASRVTSDNLPLFRPSCETPDERMPGPPTADCGVLNAHSRFIRGES